jgi:hypothetical protein
MFSDGIKGGGWPLGTVAPPHQKPTKHLFLTFSQSAISPSYFLLSFLILNKQTQKLTNLSSQF